MTDVERHDVGSLAEFPVGTHRVVRVGARSIGVFHLRSGFYALPNLCPHQTGPLCEAGYCTGTTKVDPERGWLIEWAYEGEIVACPWHGIEYHVPTGQCLPFPEIKLRTYPVEVEQDRVLLLV